MRARLEADGQDNNNMAPAVEEVGLDGGPDFRPSGSDGSSRPQQPSGRGGKGNKRSVRPVSPVIMPKVGPGQSPVDRGGTSQDTSGTEVDADELSLNSSKSTITVVATKLAAVAEDLDTAMDIRKKANRKAAVAEAFTGAARDVCRFLRARKQKNSSSRSSGRSQRGSASPPPDSEDGQPSVSEDARIMEAALEAHRLKWVAIGCDPRKSGGKLVATAMLTEAIDVATDPAPNKPGLLNGAKATSTYGYLSNCTAIAAAVSAETTSGRADWRALAIKVTLYNELRERRIIQPSGVEWAWADTDLPGKLEYPLCYRGDWHYDAIFITTDVLDASLRRAGGIPVGHRANGIEWHANDPSLVVIMLGDNGDPNGRGRDMWVLSHLTYPMVWVLETFRMYVVGKEGEGQDWEELISNDEVFSRLAGQVDINHRTNKIMFVVPTKTRNTVEIGGAVFNITSTNRWSEMPGEDGPPMVDMDAHLVDLIEGCLSSRRNLREQFSTHAKPYFPAGFNWVEIDSVITSILPRFHQRIEGSRAGRDQPRYNVGALSDVLEAYGLDPLPGLTPDSYRDYGGEYAVTALDMRPTTRSRARRNPVVLIGCWTNLAEIAVGSGYATYDTHNEAKFATFMARMESGALDRLARGRYLRVACENMKRAMGVTDTIAFPTDDPANMPPTGQH